MDDEHRKAGGERGKLPPKSAYNVILLPSPHVKQATRKLPVSGSLVGHCSRVVLAPSWGPTHASHTRGDVFRTMPNGPPFSRRIHVLVFFESLIEI